MERTTNNLIWLNLFFIASLLIANIVSSKVVFLCGLTIPAAVVAYPWTFLCTDVIGELWGKEEANRTVRRGIIIQLFSLLLISAALYLPIAPFAADFQKSFMAVLGTSWRFILASLTAYMASQTVDVIIFHWLKARCKERKKWLRNNISTMTSQIIDTAIFITIAFYGVVPDLLAMVISQYVIKFLIALCDTPIFYFLTSKAR